MPFTLTTAALDRALVTLAEVKAHLGIATATTTYDADLTALALRISDMVSNYCAVASTGVAIPTLRAETLVCTVFPTRCSPHLILPRRFIASIATVVENDETLAAGAYGIDESGKSLLRLGADGNPRYWPTGKIVVTGVFGFTTVPDGLKHACLTAIREQWSARERDPLLKAESVDGVGRLDYWVGGLAKAGMGPFSAEVAEMLAPYRTVVVA